MARKRSKKKKVVKAKVIYRNRPIQGLNQKELKEDLSNLEQRREKINERTKEEISKKKGVGKAWVMFKGAVAKSSINKSISESRRAIQRPVQLENIKKQMEIQKVRNELSELRQKNRNILTLENLGVASKSNIKKLNF